MAKYIALYNGVPYIPVYAGGETYSAIIEYLADPVAVTVTITKDGSALASTAIQVDGESYTTNSSGMITLTGDAGETKRIKFYLNDNCWAYQNITYAANGTATVDISTRYALCIYRGKKETLYTAPWQAKRPQYEVYVNDELQTSFNSMEVVNSSGIHYYEIFLVPKGAAVKYQPVDTFEDYNIELWQARCTMSGSTTHSSVTTSSYQFTMGTNDVTINDLSYSGIVVTIIMQNSPVCRFTYVNTSGDTVTTGNVTSDTSYTINPGSRFKITSAKNGMYAVYQDDVLKAYTWSNNTFTSDSLSSNTTFKIISS